MSGQRDAVERNKKPIGSLEIPDNFNMYYLKKKDRQMRFNNAGDPLLAIFDRLERRPLSKIMRDFVKELRDDTIRFISTALK